MSGGARETKQQSQRDAANLCVLQSSGTQYTLKGVDYLQLYGSEPSAIEMVYAIFANVLELDENGRVLNAHYAQKRATDYLRAYCDRSFEVEPPYEEWETALYEPPPRVDLV